MVSALAKAHFGHVSTDSCTRSLIVMAPIRTGVASLIYCLTIDGYPALAVALRRASTFVLASSKVTTASFCSRLRHLSHAIDLFQCLADGDRARFTVHARHAQR